MTQYRAKKETTHTPTRRRGEVGVERGGVVPRRSGVLPVAVAFCLAAFMLSGCGGPFGARSTSPGDKIYVHKVEEGETVEDIAEDYYGTRGRAKLIRDFNDMDHKQPEAGTVLRLPMNRSELDRLKTRERARVPYNRGLVLAEQGAFVDAVHQFKKSLSLDPGFVDADYNLGVTYQKMKSYQRALEQFEKVTRKRPQRTRYHFALGNCYFHLDRYADAAGSFEAVVEHDTSHKKAQYSLAVSFEKLGDRKRAIAAWQRYLELDCRGAWADEARKRLSRLK